MHEADDEGVGDGGAVARHLSEAHSYVMGFV